MQLLVDLGGGLARKRGLQHLPPNFDNASSALSAVTFSNTMNRADVPGFSMSRTWFWKPSSMPDFATLPMTAPMPAPTAMPRNGTKNHKPKSILQNMPETVPAPTVCWFVIVLSLPSGLRMIAAIASASMMRSPARRSASSIACRAVVVSSYPIAIRSAIRVPLLRVRRSGRACCRPTGMIAEVSRQASGRPSPGSTARRRRGTRAPRRRCPGSRSASSRSRPSAV